LEVLEAGPIGLRVHCDRPHQIWIDATPIQSGVSVVSELSKSPHTITLRIELDDKQAPEISAEFFTPKGSKAEFFAK
jgi:hypothetical protein